MKILFVGSVKSSFVLLKKLIQMEEDIVGVITTSNASINSDYVDLYPLCKYNSIDCIKTKDINNIDTIMFIKEKKPDLIYCFGFSQLLCEETIKIPHKGVIGFHPSKLPQNRGRHPLIWAMALGLSETASTFFYINEGTDNGDIISQEVIPIYYEDDANDLYNRVLDVAQKQIEIFTNEIKGGLEKRVIQDDIKANYWRKRDIEDGRIDWRMSSNNIYNLVRALTSPYAGAHFIYDNKERKIWKVREEIYYNSDNIEPGKVLEVFEDNSFIVKVGKGCIRVVDSEVRAIKKGEYL